MAGNNNVRVKLEGVVLGHPHLFKKKATMEGGTEKYRSNFTMDTETKQGKKNIAIVEAAVDKALSAVFGDKTPKIKEDRHCFYDGNDFTDGDDNVRDGYADVMYVKATSSKRITVVDRDGETPITEDDDKIYGGCVVNAYIDIWATDSKKFGGNGVFANIVGVQFVKEGERFGGATGLGKGAFTDLGDDEDGDEDESPRKKAKPSRDDDEDDRPRKKAKPSRDDDDEEDERPRKKSRPVEDEEDERPRKKSRPVEDEDNEDERPRKKAKSRRDDDEDLDDELI